MSKYGDFSGPYFPAFGLNTERYGVSLPIQSECGKMWTRIIPNADTFHAMVRQLISLSELMVMFPFIVLQSSLSPTLCLPLPYLKRRKL